VFFLLLVIVVRGSEESTEDKLGCMAPKVSHLDRDALTVILNAYLTGLDRLIASAESSDLVCAWPGPEI
jgi:hypothetical protein